MNWLQTRLNTLNYTHSDLQKALKEKGIDRVRATITGWTNKKPVSLLNNPGHTRILAEVLDWSVLELLIAAGYDIDVPDELAPLIKAYSDATEERKQELLYGFNFIMTFKDDVDR